MMQCAAGVVGVYGELLECAATMNCWRHDYGELLEDAATASTVRCWRVRHRLPRRGDGELMEGTVAAFMVGCWRAQHRLPWHGNDFHNTTMARRWPPP
jgi:hypothetical protein